MPWREQEDFIFRQTILLISTARFNDMECIALLLAALKQNNHRNFVILVLDHIFEQVMRGIEENDFKDAQRRVSVMKFISECFNYKVIHTDTLFSLLYKLINWDIVQDCEDKMLKQLDSLDDCFRIRLVCIVLDSLGRFFNKGKRALLMDRFLIFFQRYIYSKNYIFMDLEFMILDTFDSMRPRKAPKVTSLEEANNACEQIRHAEAAFNQDIDLQNPESVANAACNQEPVATLINMYCNKEQGEIKFEEKQPQKEEPVIDDILSQG